MERVLGLLCLLLPVSLLHAAQPAPLNIVLITADDMNWDSVGINDPLLGKFRELIGK